MKKFFRLWFKEEPLQEIVTTEFCINLGYIGDKLDKARLCRQNAKTRWGRNYWRQVEAQLKRTWHEGVSFYHKAEHGQFVLDLGDINRYADPVLKSMSKPEIPSPALNTDRGNIFYANRARILHFSSVLWRHIQQHLFFDGTKA